MPKVTIIGPLYVTTSMVVPNSSSRSNLLKVKRYDGTAINPIDYEVVTLDQNVNSGTINMPANPQNGEHYIFILLTGPNAITLSANGKTFAGGLTELPIPPNAAPFTFQTFFDTLYNIWRVYATN